MKKIINFEELENKMIAVESDLEGLQIVEKLLILDQIKGRIIRTVNDSKGKDFFNSILPPMARNLLKQND